jgi:hypothetical protein
VRYFAIVFPALALLLAACGSKSHRSATPTPGSSTDPFAFSTSAGTADDPTAARWQGPTLPQIIADKLVQILDTPGGSALLATTVWRCDGGKVLACTVGANLNCGQANTSREPTLAMINWCADASSLDIPASVSGHETIYAWACQDGAPVIVRQYWTPDDRAFVKEVWHQITP